MNMSEPTVLMQGRLGALKEMAATLAAHGIASELVQPPSADVNG